MTFRKDNMIAAAERQKRVSADLARRMAWNETLSAVWRIIYTFHEGMSSPFTMHRLLVDADVIRRYHTEQYKHWCSHVLPPSPLGTLVGTSTSPFLSSSAVDLQVSLLPGARAWTTCQSDFNLSDSLLSRSYGAEGRHYASFAMASYGFLLLKLLGILDDSYDMFARGSHPVDIVTHQLDLEHDDLLLADLDGGHLGIPRHFVARDVATRSIVITVRGTSSFSDVLLDLLCESAEFSGGYAHRGMRDAAFGLYFAILPTLCSALEDNKGYRLVTVGHSLGAGVAILLTKILLDNGFERVKCFAISPPPVFGPMRSVSDEWSDSLECFVHEDDIVPRLSLQTARALALEFEALGRVTATANKSRGQTSGQGSLEDLLRDGEGVQPSESLVSPLYIPTRKGIHWLLAQNDVLDDASGPSYRCVIAQPPAFANILVTRNCVTSHFPNRYVDAFDALPLPERRERSRLQAQTKPGFSMFYYDGEFGS
jgi:hypothetical protein